MDAVNPYLEPLQAQYAELRSAIETASETATREGRDLSDAELRQVREYGTSAQDLAATIEAYTELESRAGAVAGMAAAVAAGAAPESRAAVAPPLMPSAGQVDAIRRTLSGESPTPMRFTTTDRSAGEARAVVTMAGDAGTPSAALDARTLPEPRRIATAAGLPVERVDGGENVTFPVFGAGTAGVAAENAAKTEYDAISPGTAAPQMINAYTDYTRQLALSHGAFEQRLRAKLASLVAAREDVLLQAKVMATAGIQTQAFAAGAQASAVLIGAAKVQDAVGQAPDVALVNPADIGLLFGAGLANTPPGELAELDLNLFGMRVYPTAAQTAGFVLAGAWRASSRLVVGMLPTYFVDVYSGLKNNRITTLLEEAVDLAVEEPTGFISIDIAA